MNLLEVASGKHLDETRSRKRTSNEINSYTKTIIPAVVGLTLLGVAVSALRRS